GAVLSTKSFLFYKYLCDFKSKPLFRFRGSAVLAALRFGFRSSAVLAALRFGFRSSAVLAALRFGFRSSAVLAALRFEGGNYASRRSAPASRVDNGLQQQSVPGPILEARRATA